LIPAKAAALCPVVWNFSPDPISLEVEICGIAGSTTALPDPVPKDAIHEWTLPND